MLKINIFILCLVLLHLSAGDSEAAAHKYKLDSAITRALKVNPTLEEKIHALESAKMDIGVAQSYFWPRVSLVSNRNRLRNSGSFGTVDELSAKHFARIESKYFPVCRFFTHLNNLQRTMIEKDISLRNFAKLNLNLSPIYN